MVFGPLISFYRVPSGDDERYNKWCEVLNVYTKPPFKGFICINHFDEEDLVIHKNKTTLKKNAIPIFFVENGTNDVDDASTNASVGPVEEAERTTDQTIGSKPTSTEFTQGATIRSSNSCANCDCIDEHAIHSIAQHVS